MTITDPTRRHFLGGLAALAVLPIGGGTDFSSPLSGAFEEAERLRGGRIGVSALDLQTGRTVAHRADERFAMCSTFKWILGGLILQEAERHAGLLSRDITIAEADLVSHSPVTRARLGATMRVAQLCEAAICESDNTAANLLLQMIDGPKGFTSRLAAIGDATTRLDRTETALNSAIAGDERDTTTPRAMTRLLKSFLFEDLLSETSRPILRDWMLSTRNGKNRLKAGIGSGWKVGHKPGTNNTNINNDVGFLLSAAKRRHPIIISSFSDAPGALDESADRSHAHVAAAILTDFEAVSTIS